MKNLETLVKKLGALDLVWPDHTSATVALGRVPTLHERKVWQKLVHKAFGRDTLKAGYAIFGRALTLSDLARLQDDAAQWLRRTQESPSLAPLLAPFVQVRQPAPANFKGLRDSAAARGMTTQAWKWLCQQSPGSVTKLFAFGWTVEAIWWTNVLAKAQPSTRFSSQWLENGRPYLQQSLYEWACQFTDPKDRHTATLQVERLFRLVPTVVNAQSLTEYESVMSAFFTGLRSPDWTVSVAPGRTWHHLVSTVRKFNDMRLAHAKALAAARQEEEESGETWSPQIGTGQLNSVVVQELTQAKELEWEGAIMSHCVGDGGYLRGCQTGEHAVLSLTEPITSARATLQLVRAEQSGSWRIGQLAGPGNTSVPQLFWKVARELAAGVLPQAVNDAKTQVSFQAA